MNHLEFCAWLQGFFELSDKQRLNEVQVKMIKDKLSLLFQKPVVFNGSAIGPTGPNVGWGTTLSVPHPKNQ